MSDRCAKTLGIDGGERHKTFALHCAASYACMANNLGVICNGILGPKEGSLPPHFFLNLPFGNHVRNPNAATIIPLRGGSKLQGAAGPFSLPFLQDSLAFFLSPLSCGWVLEGTISGAGVRNHCAIVPGNSETGPPSPSWCPGGC